MRTALKRGGCAMGLVVGAGAGLRFVVSTLANDGIGVDPVDTSTGALTPEAATGADGPGGLGGRAWL